MLESKNNQWQIEDNGCHQNILDTLYEIVRTELKIVFASAKKVFQGHKFKYHIYVYNF